MKLIYFILYSIIYIINCNIIYVDNNSSYSIINCGLTLETACPTIYSGMLSASSQDSILIQPGRYSGKGNEGLTTVNLTTSLINIIGNGLQEFIIIECIETQRWLYSQNQFLSSISNITIKNCSSFGKRVFFNQDGGALLVTDSSNKLTITSVTFEDNIGFNGGAISISEGSLTIMDCKFINNNAAYWGGAIVSRDSGLKIIHSFFDGNQARGDLLEDSLLVIDTEQAGRGGGVYANGGSRMTVRDCIFVSNIAQIAGGAIHSKLVSGLDIWDCSFLYNSALGGKECNAENVCGIRGGALFITDIASTIKNCSFIGNQAITTDISQFAQGGAVVIASDTFSNPSMDTLFTNCTFINNTAKGLEDNNAGGYGGAIYTSRIPFNLNNCTFIANRAESQGYFTEYAACGGAMYISLTTIGVITQTLFKGNVADSGQGGAIYLTESSIVTINYNTFSSNIVYSSYVFKAQGGAIAIGHSSFGILISNIFQQNMARPKLGVYPMTYSGIGGAIFFQSSNGNITDCSFSLNVAISGQFDAGAVGGAIAAENSAAVNLVDSTFLFNSAQGFSGSNAYSNSGSGGAVMCLFSSVIFERCLFRGNWVSAGGSQYSIGGGVAIFYDYSSSSGAIPKISFDSCEFVDNVAGGEVCDSVSSPIYRAGQGGAIGIIGFSSSSVMISNTSFITNMALTDSQGIVTSFGGAIMYSLGSHLSCDECTFINNIAWNGLGDDICSGYDDSKEPSIVMSLLLSKPYLDGATSSEAEEIHERLASSVAELCSYVEDFDYDFNLILDLSINAQSKINIPSRSLVVSNTLQKRLFNQLSQRINNNYRVELKNNLRKNKPSLYSSNYLYNTQRVFSEIPMFDANIQRRRLASIFSDRIYPNILVMSGTGAINYPEIVSIYEVCGGDALSLLFRVAGGGLDSGSLQYIAHQPSIIIIGSIRSSNLVVVGLTANITIIDQFKDQPVILAALIIINSTLAFSNNMTVVNTIMLGSIVTSYVPNSISNSTQGIVQLLNINGTMSTGLVKNGILPDNSVIERLLGRNDYIPRTILKGCVLKVHGELRLAKSRVVQMNETVSTSTTLSLDNRSSIIILSTAKMSVYTTSYILSESSEGISLVNYGVIDLTVSGNPSYMNPLFVEGKLVQRNNGKTIITVSNSNYDMPSIITTTNETILGEIEIQAIEGTVYIPSSDTLTPTAWSIFQFAETHVRSDGHQPNYSFPNGTNFDRLLNYDNNYTVENNGQNPEFTTQTYSIGVNDADVLSSKQVFVTSQLSCSYRSSDYKVSSDLASDNDYMCYVCLKNHSCGYCGSRHGGCVDPGQSCQGSAFKHKNSNCCPQMCHGRGNCLSSNNQHTSFSCHCYPFYQGVSCNDLSVFTYLLITAAVFILLIGLITVRYYYFSRQQKAKVLQELRAGLLTGSADDHGAENRSYIQAIQQDLILRDVFVNYEDISFEGKIGEGSFGEVFKATFRGAQVAVKQMRAPVFMQLSDRDIEEFRSEAYMMSRLRHPNIVLVMGISIVSFPKPAPPPGFDDDDMVMGGNKDSSVDRPRSISRDRKGKDKDKDKEDNMIRSICIITEYLEQGSLADILYGSNRVADEFWTYELVLTCALQAARGMLYLHSHQPPICHRDLKSSNLVVDDHWVVKVTDFGMSRIVPEKMQDMEKGVEGTENRSSDKSNNNKSKEDNIKNKNEETKEENGNNNNDNNNNNNNGGEEEEDNVSNGNDNNDNNGKEKKKKVNFNEEANVSWERESIINPEDSIERHSNIMMTSNLGTTAWCAPELLTSTIKARYSVKVDVYSYGMVLWELWERKRPYEELYSRFDIIDAVREGRRPAISTNCPPAYRSLIQRCWHDQPARRPTFAYIVRYIKDELAHVKRQRATSVSAQIFSPLQQLMASGRVNSDNHLMDSNEYPIQEKPQVEKQTEKKTSNWKFISPIAAFANLTNQNDPEKQSTRPTSPVGRESESAVSAPTVIQSRKDLSDRDDEMTSRSTFSHPPRISSIRSTPLTVPQKPTQQNLDEFPEESTTRNSSAWRDKYVLKFSGWNQSKPDSGLPPSLAPRPLSSSVVPPVPQERHIDRMESDSQDDSSDETVSNKESSFVDAKGSNGEPLPAEIAVELDTYSSSNSVV